MLALASCSMDHNRIVCPITDPMQRPKTPPHHAPRRAGWDCWMLVVQKMPLAIPPLTRELIFSPSKVPLLGGIVHIFRLVFITIAWTWKDFRRLETLYNLGANVCQQIFCQRQINGFLVNCRCPDIRLLGGKTNFVKSDFR